MFGDWGPGVLYAISQTGEGMSVTGVMESGPLRLPCPAPFSDLSETFYHRGLAGLGVSEGKSGPVDSGVQASEGGVCVYVLWRQGRRGWVPGKGQGWERWLQQAGSPCLVTDAGLG